MGERRISRRDFNKLALTGVGFLGLNVLGLKVVIDRKRENSPLLDQSQRKDRELELYGINGIRAIRSIEERSGLTISLPDTIPVQNPFDGTSSRNDVWKLDELEVLNKASSKLPKDAKENREIAFGVIRSKETSGVGGLSPEGIEFGLRLPSLILITPEKYNLNEQSSKTELWKNKSEEFEAVFMHEMTHLLVERNPHLIKNLNDYLNEEGWYKDHGVWQYGGNSRIVEFMRSAGLENTKHWGPKEDVAFSSMLYTTNPRYLVEGTRSDKRRFVFLSSEIYSGALYF